MTAAMVLPLLRKHGLVLALILALLFQGWNAHRQIQGLTRAIEAQKVELAEARGAVVRLREEAAALRPGETKTVYVDRPKYIPYAVPGPVRTEFIRTPGTVQTRVETIQLPPKEIERIVREAPQSITVTLTATRNILAGESFRVVASQIQPGVWQGILDLDAPVTAVVTTDTPVDRIPQIPVASRFNVTAYTDYSTRWRTAVTGLVGTYRITPTFSVRLGAEHYWNGLGQDYRVGVQARW